MKKVLIISLIFIFLFIVFDNIIWATNITSKTNTITEKNADYVIKLHLNEKYSFNGKGYAYFVDRNVVTWQDGISEEATAITITGSNTGETTGQIFINNELKTVYVKVALKFLENVLIIPPVQTKYDVGEKLNLEGLAVTAVYDNGTVEEITKGYKVTGYNKNKEGKQTVTISYQGFSRKYTVKVGNSNVEIEDVENNEKLPQTGDFFDIKDGLYLTVGILSLALIYMVFKIVKYGETKNKNL